MTGTDVESTIKLLKKLNPRTDEDKEAVRIRLEVLEGYGEYINQIVDKAFTPEGQEKGAEVTPQTEPKAEVTPEKVQEVPKSNPVSGEKVQKSKAEVVKSDVSQQKSQDKGDQVTTKQKEQIAKNRVVPEKPKPDADDYAAWQSEYGTDPDEIYQAHQDETSNTPFNRLQEWQQELIQGRNTRVSRTSFARFGDPNWIGKNIVVNWLTKNPNDRDGAIDGLAEYLSELHNITITPNDIVEFIRDNPTRYARKTTDTQKDSKEDINKLRDSRLGRISLAILS